MMDITAGEILDIISQNSIEEYGVYRAPLADALKAVKSADSVVAALNNSDTDGVLLELLEKDPESIIFGLKAIAAVLGTEKTYIHLPEWADDTAKKIAPHLAQNGVELKCSLVNRRSYSTSFLCHIVTASDVSDALCGKYERGVYVSLNGGEIRKYPSDTKISALVDQSDIKAVKCGYRIRPASDCSLTLEEAKIENGVLSVITNSGCVIDEVSASLHKSRMQSCGKCVFCREGLIQLDEMHSDITHKKGKHEYIDLATEIGEAMSFSTPCSMGQISAQVALSAIKAFKDDYDAHIKKKTCVSGKCTSFINIYIDPLLCTGCGKCVEVCPADCIDGMPHYIHLVGEFECTKCGKCLEVCRDGAIVKTTSRVPKLPDRFVKVGKFKKR